MPVGCVSLVAPIVADLAPKRPRKILDAGMGMGFWGAVVRQWIDNGYASKTHMGANGADVGMRKPIWPTYLMGIEGFAKYRNHAWGLYDFVHLRTIQDYLAEFKTDRFDAIFLLDVLEHFEEMEGMGVLVELMGRLTPPNSWSNGGTLYVGTPGVWMEQGAAYGNELERHRSMWEAKTLREGQFEIMGLEVEHTQTAAINLRYDFDGTYPDPWGNQMLLAKWEANAANLRWLEQTLEEKAKYDAERMSQEHPSPSRPEATGL